MTNPAWQHLTDELSHWYDSGLRCRFWWRDDDLIAVTPELQHMQTIADEFLVYVLAAIIPAQMSPTLGRDTAGIHRFVWCQHGYAHQNHATNGELNSEFPANRDKAAMCDELARGRQLLQQQFGERLLPVLVPPWNRLCETLYGELARLGFCGLSRYGDVATAGLEGITTFDTHVDVVDWSTAPTFPTQREALLADLITKELKQRREIPALHNAPFGLLTHHRAMDANAWRFVHNLMAVTHEVPCVEWVSPRDLFGSG